MKTRIDKLMVERGLVPSRERAQALILAGKVLVNEQKVEKAGASVESDAAIRLLGEDLRYVSRGGLKLEKALAHWQIEVRGRVCMDVGASTGGFTDCLLQHGAARVIAVDTGRGQMDARLRNDPRVKLLEKTNARYLTAEQVGEAVSFVAMDVSFISACLVLPAVVASLQSPVASRGRDAREPAGQPPQQAKTGLAGDPGSTPALLEFVVLVKPQFEVGREKVGKGGIVRDEAAQQEAIAKVRRAVEDLGGREIEVIESPITGAEGNREWLLHARFGGRP